MAFRVSIPAVAETFRLLSGTPSVYLKTTADSGIKSSVPLNANVGRHESPPRCMNAEKTNQFRFSVRE